MSKTSSTRTIRRFNKAVDKVLDKSNELVNALEELSSLASEIYGEELIADICDGEEIEFRVNGDVDSILHIDDIVERLI
jgi:predicted thioredoxin/glutaredoxin